MVDANAGVMATALTWAAAGVVFFVLGACAYYVVSALGARTGHQRVAHIAAKVGVATLAIYSAVALFRSVGV